MQLVETVCCEKINYLRLGIVSLYESCIHFRLVTGFVAVPSQKYPSRHIDLSCSNVHPICELDSE